MPLWKYAGQREMNEIKLIQKVAAGDEDAFCDVVRTNRNMVINVCYSLLNDREKAEETAQDVFLQIYKKAGEFQGKSKLSTWIYRIAVNHAISARRRDRLSKKSEIIQQKVSADLVYLEASKADSPDSRLEAKEIRKIFHNALDSLPEKQRSVIILHKMEGLSSKEIAQILNISLSSAEARIHRAKINLKKKLSHLLSGS
ncbi:MAG: sigma-70 family RNA polymerase sigma factor [Acidobacteriota bacterium]